MVSAQLLHTNFIDNVEDLQSKLVKLMALEHCRHVRYVWYLFGHLFIKSSPLKLVIFRFENHEDLNYLDDIVLRGAAVEYAHRWALSKSRLLF